MNLIIHLIAISSLISFISCSINDDFIVKIASSLNETILLGPPGDCQSDLALVLVTCPQVISEDYKNSDMTSLKNKCCAIWDIVDCVVDEVKGECPDTVIEQATSKFTGPMKTACTDYPHGSLKCHFPWWGITLIVIAVVIALMAAGGAIGYFVFKRMKRQSNRW